MESERKERFSFRCGTTEGQKRCLEICRDNSNCAELGTQGASAPWHGTGPEGVRCPAG